MLAPRLPYGVDERQVAGGLFGAPLEVRHGHGIAVPAHAEFVLEGVIDPEARAEEGPVRQNSPAIRPTFHQQTARADLDSRRDLPTAAGRGGRQFGSSTPEPGRIPRESEMVEKLKERFPGVTAVHYPSRAPTSTPTSR